jgi:RNA polymerase sigma-70 factor (ECF subfamily)
MRETEQYHIIEDFRKGSTRSLNYIYNLYYAPLCFFANRIIHNKEEAEDIVIEIFLKLWMKHEDFNSLPAIKSFLYTAAKNSCINHLKHQKRATASKQEIFYLTDKEEEDLVQAQMVKADLLHKIFLEIEALPVKYRNIVRLVYFEGLSHAAIAEQLNVTQDVVRVQKARALNLLRLAMLKKKLIPALLLEVAVLRIFSEN